MGNTVITIEHNLDIVKDADYLSIWARKVARKAVESLPAARLRSRRRR